MSCRLALFALAAGAAPALAQPQIDYRSGEYPYPTEQTAAATDTVVTQTAAADETPSPAERAIPPRQAGPAPVFVSNPVVQGTSPVPAVSYAAQIPAVAATETPVIAQVVPEIPVQTQPPVYYTYQMVQPSPASTVAYAYPTGGAARVIYPAGAPRTLPDAGPAYAYPRTYVATTTPLPPGAQVVSFDPAVWLAACRERLAGYDPADRDAAIAALGYAAARYAPGGDHCAAYLDSYMASAAAGTLAVPPQYGQQYMLVPMTAAPVPTPVN